MIRHRTEVREEYPDRVWLSTWGVVFWDVQPWHVGNQYQYPPTSGVWTLRDGELASFRNHLAPFGSSRSKIDSHAFLGPVTVTCLWSRSCVQLDTTESNQVLWRPSQWFHRQRSPIQWWSHTMQPVWSTSQPHGLSGLSPNKNRDYWQIFL